jgi:hypothetical protein
VSPCPAEETRSLRPEASSASPPGRTEGPDGASPLAGPGAEAIEFIRFCRGRRRVGWPELYDEMVLVACRGLFHGYGLEELAGRGVAFNLAALPRLAELVALVVAEERPPVKVGAARRGRAVVGGVAGRDDGSSTAGREREDPGEPAAAAAGLPVMAAG